MMELKDYIKPYACDIAFWMAGFQDPEYPTVEIGNLGLELSRKLRSLAIMVLLVKLDSDLFYHNLIRSGLTRVTYLTRLKQEKMVQDHHFVSGRYEPLLDAIAAGNWQLAQRIAALSPENWQKEREYIDDYCYAQILHRLTQEEVVETEVTSLLAEFEAYLEGHPDARLDVCRALFLKDQRRFDEGFKSLLEQRENKIAKDIERGQLEDPEVIAQRLVFVEGLAILKLAGRFGIATQKEYQFCPSVARIPMVKPFPGE